MRLLDAESGCSFLWINGHCSTPATLSVKFTFKLLLILKNAMSWKQILHFFFFFFFETEFRSCYPGWSAMAQSRLTATSAPWVQAILLHILSLEITSTEQILLCEGQFLQGRKPVAHTALLLWITLAAKMWGITNTVFAHLLQEVRDYLFLWWWISSSMISSFFDAESIEFLT